MTRKTLNNQTATTVDINPAAIGAEPAISRTGAAAGSVLSYNGTALALTAPVAPGPSYNLTPQNLKRLRRSLARVRSGTSAARLFCLGDSTTAGTGATPQTSYPTQLAKQLTAAGIPAVQTWANTGAADPRVTVTGTGPYTFTYTPSDATMAGPAQVDTFDIYSLNGSYSGSVNGGTVTSWTAPADFTSMTKTTITCTRGASNVLTITGNSQFVYGMNAYDSTTPVVQIANCGIPGTTSGNTTTMMPATPASGTNTLSLIGRVALVYQPDCTIYDIGINDASASIAAATYGANITATVSYLQSKTSDVILKSMIPSSSAVNSGTNLIGETAYQPQIQSVSTTLKAPLFDGFARWESYVISSPFGYYGDTVHASSFGYADIAGGLVGMIRTV